MKKLLITIFIITTFLIGSAFAVKQYTDLTQAEAQKEADKLTAKIDIKAKKLKKTYKATQQQWNNDTNQYDTINLSRIEFIDEVNQTEVNNDKHSWKRKDYTNASNKIEDNVLIIGNRAYKKTYEVEDKDGTNTTFVVQGYIYKFVVDNDANDGLGRELNKWTFEEFMNESKVVDGNTEVYRKSLYKALGLN